MKVADRRSSRPEGWLPAGAKVPISLTVKQEAYCRRARGVRRFCYNLAVATHRFHRTNRLPWPSWQDIYKAFNACKAEDYPFVTEVASRVAEGAFMDFGRAIANWRNPDLKAHFPTFIKRKATGEGSFRAASGVAQIRYDGKAPGQTSSQRLGKARMHPAQGHLPRGPHPQTERTLVPLPETVAGTHTSTDTGHPDGRGGRYRHQPQRHRFRRPSVPEPQGLLRNGTEAQTLAAGPGAPDEGLPRAGGKPSGGSTGATAAYAESGTTPSTR